MTEQTEQLPPSYDLSGFPEELPAYTRVVSSASPVRHSSIRANPSLRQDTKTFSYEIKSWGKAWATLTVLADSRVSGETPAFIEGGNIEGSLKLNLRNKDGIKSVFIFVRGDLVTSAPTRRENFLRLREYLWASSMGDPRRTRLAGVLNEEWTEKLQGEYEWRFSVKIPTFSTELADSGEEFRLPHSFLERDAAASIDYYLGLRVHRSRFQPDDMLVTQFGYYTMQRPPNPSLLRQLADESNVPVPGPHVDPQGWQTLGPVQIRGRVFGERTVDARCTILLANPLCYTRGAAIPCAMTIETNDAQTANLLASINSSAIYLQQCLKIDFGGTSKDYFSSRGQALWWPDASAPPSSHQRFLLGEIHLSKDLHPSSALKLFRVEYSVVLFPLEVPGFTPESFVPLASKRVEIVTRFAPGIRPQLATPPYRSSSPLVEQYYKSVSEVASKPSFNDLTVERVLK